MTVIEQSRRYWQAQAMLARASGHFDLAQEYEGYARQKFVTPRGAQTDYTLSRDTVSLESAVAALNALYTGALAQ